MNQNLFTFIIAPSCCWHGSFFFCKIFASLIHSLKILPLHRWQLHNHVYKCNNSETKNNRVSNTVGTLTPKIWLLNQPPQLMADRQPYGCFDGLIMFTPKLDQALALLLKANHREEVEGSHMNQHALKGKFKEAVTYPWQNLHVVQSILCFQGWFASIVRYKTAACREMKKTPMSHTWLSY